jgi:outer membrane protein assembly factor BamB
MSARVRFAAVALPLALAAAACGGGGGDRSDRGTAPTTTSGAAHAAPTITSLRLIQAWRWSAPDEASAGMPAADGGGIAVLSGRKRLTLLDQAGEVLWQVERSDLRDVAPALTESLVLAPTDDGLAAYDRATGRERWVATLGDRANTPALAGGRAVVTTWDGLLAAVDVATGKEAWRMRLGGNVLGPAAAAGGTAVATFDSGRVAGAVSVDVATGRQRWAARLPADGVSSPAISTAAGTAVMVVGDVSARGLSLDDGSERWRRPLDGSGSPEVPPLAFGDGRVLLAHRLSGLVMVDARDGRVEWEARADDAAVRGGPAGPGPNGWFALPLNDGRLMLAGPDRTTDVRDPPGLTSGVATGPDGLLLVGIGQGDENGLSALRGW